jgi:four helix bundle protein
MALQFHLDCKSMLLRIETNKNVKEQLTRASYSIPLNIAEGSGKFTNPDKRNYFVIARASVNECVSILEILWADGAINKNEFHALNDVCDQMSRMLYKMIKNLETK